MITFTRDLLAQGLLPHEIRTLVRRGDLIRIRYGAYVRSDDAETPEAIHLRAVLAAWPRLRPGACLSHHTAGVVHDLPVPRGGLGPVHITRSGRGGASGQGLCLHRGTIPAAHRLTTPYGVVTSVPWTVVDLARVLPPIQGVAVADAALAAGLPVDHPWSILDTVRRQGNVQARKVLRFADPRSESVGESHSRWLMAELGLPAPELQHVFHDAWGRFVARTDFWWPDYGLVGEFDGVDKYTRAESGKSPQQVVLEEKRREEALRGLGVWVVRWDWKTLDDRAGFKARITKGLEFASRVRRH